MSERTTASCPVAACYRTDPHTHGCTANADGIVQTGFDTGIRLLHVPPEPQRAEASELQEWKDRAASLGAKWQTAMDELVTITRAERDAAIKTRGELGERYLIARERAEKLEKALRYIGEFIDHDEPGVTGCGSRCLACVIDRAIAAEALLSESER